MAARVVDAFAAPGIAPKSRMSYQYGPRLLRAGDVPSAEGIGCSTFGVRSLLPRTSWRTDSGPAAGARGGARPPSAPYRDRPRRRARPGNHLTGRRRNHQPFGQNAPPTPEPAANGIDPVRSAFVPERNLT